MTKVLIVEDDQSLQLMYTLKLETVGFVTQAAENGRVGLQKAETFMPDVILLDLRMPEMTGDEMLKHLREAEWGCNMHVIILTNISRSEAPKSLSFLGVDRYVVKAHTTPSQVAKIVQEVLGQRVG